MSHFFLRTRYVSLAQHDAGVTLVCARSSIINDGSDDADVTARLLTGVQSSRSAAEIVMTAANNKITLTVLVSDMLACYS